MTSAVIVSTARTPLAKSWKGSFNMTHGATLGGHAIAHAVDELLARSGHRALSVEGLPQARWVLIDLVDVVVHVFLEDARSLYDLDGLWMDARRVPVPESAEARAGGGSVRPGSRGDGPTEEPEEP